MLVVLLACARQSAVSGAMVPADLEARADALRHETIDSDPLHHVFPEQENPDDVELVIRYAWLYAEDRCYHRARGEDAAAAAALVQQEHLCRWLPAALSPPWDARRAEACAVDCP